MKLDGWQIPLGTIAGVIGASAYFYHPATSSEAVAAWVQAIGSIGAILAAVWVAHRQYEQTRQLELERAKADAAKEQAETEAFVQAVVQELTTIWVGYEATIRPHLYAVGENEFFNGIVPVGTDLFTIYNNASPRVGKVKDEELRRLIVQTYARAKGFVYSLIRNNEMVTEMADLALAMTDETFQRYVADKKGALVRYAVQLKRNDEELERLLRDLTARANMWFRS